MCLFQSAQVQWVGGGDFEDKDLEVSVLLVMLSPC